jgi:tRNA threonylcarbamoyl adenosine modification protein YeaZ
MRLVLAIEASSRTYAVAVGAGELPSAQRASRRDAPAFAGLGDLVAQTLAAHDATFSDIEAIAVDIGPGGLSSIRAAVAYANGLAFSLGVKVFPVSSLELMAIAAQPAPGSPLLCVKRGVGGNTYAGLFVNGEVAAMRHGPASAIVPEIAAGLEEVRVAGVPAGDVAGFLPGVTVTDTGIADADVIVLYQAARAALADEPERLVPLAGAINEGSLIFHQATANRHPVGNDAREEG